MASSCVHNPTVLIASTVGFYAVPGAEPSKSAGTAVYQSLYGGRYSRQIYRGMMGPDGPEFEGTVVEPDIFKGGTRPMRGVQTYDGKDTIVLENFEPQDNGTERPQMRITYSRKK
ncbi:MAG: hypothetical protein O2819_00150 [Planctomycetota bacterium]|nr:hypothetical protein [Planctomycetota bacterium]MDA1105357.1 hypothetical protein [Planctomycetota bacterium]